MIKADKINNKTGRHMLINEGIDRAYMKNEVDAFCPLGNNTRTLTVETYIEFGKYIPDFLDIEDTVKELNNKDFIHEDFINEWIKRLEIYEPKQIKVRVYASGHFPMYEETVRNYN